MNTIASYRRSAERCRELAERAESEEERKLLLRLAESWDWLTRDVDLPADRRRNLQPQKTKGEG
jgi:hypothetical protein